MNLAYLELKLSWQLHSQAPEALPTAAREKLRHTARRQEALESLILQSPEAMCAVVTPASIAERQGEIRARYESENEFQGNLARLGMNASMLETAIARDLAIENTLERVSSAIPAATDTDAEIFYLLHPERCTRPERRSLRHILITFSDRRERRAAYALLQRLRSTLNSAAEFGDAAMRHSHCPSALDGGRLGAIRPGQLFPELEEVAFAMAADTVSRVLRSEAGLHLLRCDAIEAAEPIPFAQIRDDIRQRLSEAREEQARRQWIAGLARAARG